MSYLCRLATRRLVAVLMVTHVAFTTTGWSAVVPEDVKKVVAFVFSESADSRENSVGTGFWVTVRNEDNPKIVHGYLVTARHVVVDDKGQLAGKVSVRLNKREGATANIKLDTSNVLLPADRHVDLAAFPALPPQDLYDIRAIAADLFLGREQVTELGFREGADIFFSGLFLNYIGRESNQPVVRFGKLALLSSESIPWQGVLRDLFLVETFSFGGNSGAPIFFYPGADHQPGVLRVGTPDLKLAGILIGHFNDPRPLTLELGESGSISIPSTQNQGIAAVVPAWQLYDLLISERAMAFRKAALDDETR